VNQEPLTRRDLASIREIGDSLDPRADYYYVKNAIEKCGFKSQKIGTGFAVTKAEARKVIAHIEADRAYKALSPRERIMEEGQ